MDNAQVQRTVPEPIQESLSAPPSVERAGQLQPQPMAQPPAQPAPQPTPMQHQTTVVHTTVNVQQSPLIVMQSSGPSLLVRLIYFVLIGWWVGALASAFAWLCVVTVIFLPLGLALINRLPSLITLRPQGNNWRVEGNMLVHGQAQRPFVQRAVYFVLVGWWLSGVWLFTAYLALLTVFLIPLSFWMYGRVGAVTTLYRS